ncbi:MAG: hypothetical protein LC733_11230, partial [Actinobacteria bacterium]|nr:hypothetical protein [Actinomycetota bacterium]
MDPRTGPAGRRLWGLALALLLVLAACGGGSDEEAGSGTSTTEPAVSTSSSTVSQTTSTELAAPGSPLQRRDVPPEGVKAQFEYFQEGDGACFGLDESRPAAVVDFEKPEMATSFIICFPGFAPNQPVQADVRLPDGKMRKISSESFNVPEGVPFSLWTAVPGDPLGTYEVTATQGALRGTGRFTVSVASSPNLVEIEPLFGPAGSVFRFALAGFPPNRNVELYLYRQTEAGPYSFLTTLSPRMDGKGETILTVHTAPDDPPGVYCLLRRG